MAYLSPPRMRAVLKPVNLPSCGVRKEHGGVVSRFSTQPDPKPSAVPACPRTSLVNFRVCRASSRVGERMRARAPAGLGAFSRSNMGMRKQAVFPLPVRAIATTSRPRRITGMVCGTQPCPQHPMEVEGSQKCPHTPRVSPSSGWASGPCSPSS